MNVTESCFPNASKFDIKIELKLTFWAKLAVLIQNPKLSTYLLAWEIRIGNKIIDKLNALLSKIIMA